MPGGSDYRQWYAMKKRLEAVGKWQGKASHKVLSLEEGEPRPKEPRTSAEPLAADSSSSSSPIPPSNTETASESTPDSLPPLESPETAEGKHVSWIFFINLG